MDEVNEKSFELISELSIAANVDERLKLIENYMKTNETVKKLAVNDFEEGLEWFNVKGELSLKRHLKSKLVVLDFFTYCCVNCMHILPDLEELESRFKDEDGVVVVGVHSAKFENEKVSENIRSAILRYGITHPVVNDHEAVMWNELGIQCWPTQLVLGPNNEVLVSMVGEGHRQNMLDFIAVARQFYRDKDQLSSHKIDLDLCKDHLPSSPLLFPGKVAFSTCGEYLAISDTGHHRVLICDSSGLIKHKIGSGEVGLVDGGFKHARFRAPQGVCWGPRDDTLYVADTDNHVIRQINVSRGQVTTVVGTGEQGRDLEGGQRGTQQSISSPWDLVLGKSLGSEEDNVLFVAMAGTHQVWAYFLTDGTWLKKAFYTAGTCVRIVGSGNEENRNNNYPHKASFAQPSGITVADFNVTTYTRTKGPKPIVNVVRHLVIADSESSSMRSVNLLDGSVKAVVGGERDPKNLFAFGDVDGRGYDAKLQHPLGVSTVPDQPQLVYVADSYNHKIKRIDLNEKESTTVIGCGKSGDYTGSESHSNPALNEPGGLCVHPNSRRLFIADTNNHCVKIYDTHLKTLSKFAIIQPEDLTDSAPKPAKQTTLKSIANKRSTRVTEKALCACAGDQLDIRLFVELKTGLHFTEGAPSACQILVKDKDPQKIIQEVSQKRSLDGSSNPVTFSLRLPDLHALEVAVECVVFYCDDAGVCMNKGYVFYIPVIMTSSTHDAALHNAATQQIMTLNNATQHHDVSTQWQHGNVYANEHTDVISSATNQNASSRISSNHENQNLLLSKRQLIKEDCNQNSTVDSRNVIQYSLTIVVPKNIKQ